MTPPPHDTPRQESVEEIIKSILLRNFDNDEYLWSVANKELKELFESAYTAGRAEGRDSMYKEIYNYDTGFLGGSMIVAEIKRIKDDK